MRGKEKSAPTSKVTQPPLQPAVEEGMICSHVGDRDEAVQEGANEHVGGVGSKQVEVGEISNYGGIKPVPVVLNLESTLRVWQGLLLPRSRRYCKTRVAGGEDRERLGGTWKRLINHQGGNLRGLDFGVSGGNPIPTWTGRTWKPNSAFS